METVFWYFLKRSLDNTQMRDPVPFFSYLGEIGDYVDLDGVGYIITDYAVENFNYRDMM